MANFEQLQLLVASYSAILQTVQVWQSTKDRLKALDAFDVLRSLRLNESSVKEQARALQPVVPQDIADLIERRLGNCWTEFYKILNPSNGKSPAEVDACLLYTSPSPRD